MELIDFARVCRFYRSFCVHVACAFRIHAPISIHSARCLNVYYVFAFLFSSFFFYFWIICANVEYVNRFITQLHRTHFSSCALLIHLFIQSPCLSIMESAQVSMRVCACVSNNRLFLNFKWIQKRKNPFSKQLLLSDYYKMSSKHLHFIAKPPIELAFRATHSLAFFILHMNRASTKK